MRLLSFLILLLFLHFSNSSIPPILISPSLMTFPDIDPIALAIGPLTIRWYALAYVAGIMLGYLAIVRDAARFGPTLSREAKDNLVLFAILGVMLGGRLGYVLFYQTEYYLDHPLEALKIWQGGMSFHGGMLGVIAAFFLFAKKYLSINSLEREERQGRDHERSEVRGGRGGALHAPPANNYLTLMDRIALAAPIGLFFGRIANFINGELFGRATDVPWGMVFPRGGPIMRHPSQLYEAALEGLLLFIILFVLTRFTSAPKRPGFLSGVFLLGYGAARFVVEFFREPDEQLGFLWLGATMGQLLCVPMIVLGVWLMVRRVARGA